jgi:hypothetical protein
MPASRSAHGVTNVVPHMIEFDSQLPVRVRGCHRRWRDDRDRREVEGGRRGAGDRTRLAHGGGHPRRLSGLGLGDRAPGDPSTQALVEIPLDLDVADPQFAIGRRVVVEEVLEPYAAARGWEYPGYQPVCHQFTPDSREAWVTLGPQWNRGGLFVLDLRSATVTAAWDPEVVKANCGVAVNREGTRVVANWSGAVIGPGQDTEGEWYSSTRRTSVCCGRSRRVV